MSEITEHIEQLDYNDMALDLVEANLYRKLDENNMTLQYVSTKR